MNILVTGATGFIGREIVSALRMSNHVIKCGKKERNCDGDKDNYVRWDLSDRSWPKELEDIQIDAIVHCAAQISIDDNDEDLVIANCLGTYNIFRFAICKRIKKVLYISSLPIIGKPEGVIKEDSKIDPQSVYHATKAFGEYIIKQVEKYGLGYAIFRITSPIGSGMSTKTILSVMIKRAIRNESLLVYGKGTRRQNYIDVRDIGFAISEFVKIKKIENGIYNLASNRTYSNLEVALLCKTEANSSSEILFSDTKDPYDDWNYDVNIDKLEGIIGTYIRYELKDTIDMLINEYK